MEDNANLAEGQSDEFSAETLSAAKIFEQLPVETQEEILALMREMLENSK